VDGQRYNLYWGEMHTHITEFPYDRIEETSIDRYFLYSRFKYGLDVGTITDHDWRQFTNTMYAVQQAVSKRMDKPGKYTTFSGFEWSGDNQIRLHYGDRTVIFLDENNKMFRIYNEESNTPAKLHRFLKEHNGIAWPHHIGGDWAVMDWKLHDPVSEPVCQIASTHGIYERYDEKNFLTTWRRDKVPVSRTSIQYALSIGKKFGLICASDSHSGIPGFATGMVGIYAEDLTRESIFNAIKQRRVYAVWGGDPIFIDFRVNDAMMGRETEINTVAYIEIHVKGSKPLSYLEIVRNNDIIYATNPGAIETKFTYTDKNVPNGENYYYIRVTQPQRPLLPEQIVGWDATWKESSFAWSSPIWVTKK